MKEATLRKWHRKMGLFVAILIVLQAATGLILTIEDILGSYWGGIVHDIHRHYELAGHIYRMIAGTGMVFMVVTGVWIGLKMSRRKKSSSEV